MSKEKPGEAEIVYPYCPEDRHYEYVDKDHPFMRLAKEVAFSTSLDKTMPTASVIAKDEVILATAANGSDYHQKKPCERVARNIKTGEGYELCEGCHPKNHSEAKAVASARDKGIDLSGADLYLWGHWWCCKPCFDAMEKAGIAHVYLERGSEIKYNKQHPNNIVGRQFENFPKT